MDKQLTPSVPVYECDASESPFPYAFKDLAASLRHPELVYALIRTGFLQKYTSVLSGVFWITLTTLLIVTGLALLYGEVFGAERVSYMPYVAGGIIIWGLIASLLNDGAGVFIAASGVYGQIPIPKSVFVMRTVGIAAIAFVIKLSVFAGVVFYVGLQPSLQSVGFAFLGLLLALWTGFWFTLIWGTLGARFRDIPVMTNAFVTIAFFATPVFWQPERLGNYRWIVDFNPLHHFINTMRGPLLGLDGVAVSFYWSLGTAAATTVLGLIVYGLFARRLTYWN